MSHPYDVLAVPECSAQLLLTPCPGLKDTPVSEALDTLKQAGASALVTLMPEPELQAQGIEDLEGLCAEHQLEWFHLPIADEQVPQADFDQAWGHAQMRLQHLLDQGRAIAIHCKGGSGRTGLFAARLLMRRGIPKAQAVALVQQLRPKAIQHPAHVAWLAQFDVH